MDPVTLTYEMIVVLTVLFVTVTLFITEAFRIDLTAILTMLALGLLSQVPGLGNLADTSRLFDGFASNAVISIIAVMIIGAGLDKTGLMSKVAGYILKLGGAKETRIVPIISGSVGVISSFMQNVGAAALFLPVLSRISVRGRIADVSAFDAHGVLRHFGRYDHHGGLVTADFAQRSDGCRQCRIAG